VSAPMRTRADVERRRLVRMHKLAYDSLAEHYEARADLLRPLTQSAAQAFADHVNAGPVLDVGCGVGLMIECLMELGVHTEGVDVAPRMVELARARNPSATVFETDSMRMERVSHYRGIVALAFIHLFPKDLAMSYLRSMYGALQPGGTLLVNTTRSDRSSEGYSRKLDYPSRVERFRKRWTEDEMHQCLRATGFTVLEYAIARDPFGKCWMDFFVRRPVARR
jgi:2-polyprenyl-3-methyl-5-hydroxy-6-metoxy-1,4-benzoquinol methylase